MSCVAVECWASGLDEMLRSGSDADVGRTLAESAIRRARYRQRGMLGRTGRRWLCKRLDALGMAIQKSGVRRPIKGKWPIRRPNLGEGPVPGYSPKRLC